MRMPSVGPPVRPDKAILHVRVGMALEMSAAQFVGSEQPVKADHAYRPCSKGDLLRDPFANLVWTRDATAMNEFAIDQDGGR